MGVVFFNSYQDADTDPVCLLTAQLDPGDPTMSVDALPDTMALLSGQYTYVVVQDPTDPTARMIVKVTDIDVTGLIWDVDHPEEMTDDLTMPIGSKVFFVVSAAGLNEAAGGGLSAAPNSSAYITDGDETADLPNSRQISDVALSELDPHTDRLLIAKDWGHTAALSPAQITATTDDYAPTGIADAAILRIDTDASHTLSGIAAPSPDFARRLIVEYVGVNEIVLLAEGTNSTAANRFALPEDTTLGPNQSIELLRDVALARWVAVGGVGSGTLADHTHESAGGQGGTIDEDALVLADVTTNNASTSNHGFLKKLPNDNTLFLDGTGNWSTPSGGGGSGSSEHSYLGYNTVGASWETATNYRRYFKKITVPKDGTLASIGVHLRQHDTASTVQGQAALFMDNSGPDHVIAICPGAPDPIGWLIGGTDAADWLHFPIDRWVEAGDYWLMVQFQKSGADIQIAYDTGGTDPIYTPSGLYAFGNGASEDPTDSTKNYSIRADFYSAPSDIVLQDNFNRANEAPLGNPQIGDGPTEFLDFGATPARWGVTSNKLAPQLSEAENAIAWPVYSMKYTMTCTLSTPATDGGPVVRVDGSSGDWFVLQTQTSGFYRLYRRIGGSYTLVETGTHTPTAGDVIVIVVDGTHITVSINGTQEFSHTSGRLSEKMMVGFRENLATGLRIDDLTVTVP